MATTGNQSATERVVESVRGVGWGGRDPRVRATWRVLLAMPVLWVLTGGVLAGNVQSTVGVIPDAGATGGLAQSLLHAGFFLVALAAWARYLDRRPLSEYGVSASPRWGRDGVVGFAAVLVGFGAWTGVTSALGGTSVTVAPSVPQGSVLLGVIAPFVALVLHAAVQQVVFFRVILESAAEGLHSRGLGARRALAGAVPVAVLLFVVMHGQAAPLRLLDLAVAGGVFGMLYLHTGELALGIGAHFGALYGGIVVSALLRVTGSLSGVPGVLDQYGFPKMLVAYVVILAWLRWRRGAVPIRSDVAQWSTD